MKIAPVPCLACPHTDQEHRHIYFESGEFNSECLYEGCTCQKMMREPTDVPSAVKPSKRRGKTSLRGTSANKSLARKPQALALSSVTTAGDPSQENEDGSNEEN
jgi:hypothetical protein